MSKLGLYIHIPFCKSKCNYCDFISYADKHYECFSYKNKLIKEIKKVVEKNSEIKSIFFGGGTPSIFPTDYIREILSALSYYKKTSNVEITIEANPNTLDKDKLKDYLDMGINRLSVGLQSHDKNLLKILGRTHTFDDFERNIFCAKNIGFKNISADVMFSLPNQTLDIWKETIEKLISFELNHISAYSLIIEKNTPFGKLYDKNQLTLPDDKLDREMYYFLRERLLQANFRQYEFSNFAKVSHESVHNKIYWQRENYIGVGLGAHSFVDGVRYSNTTSLDDYLNLENVVVEEHKIDILEAMEEFVFLGLRMTQGIETAKFQKEFSKDVFDVFGGNLKSVIELGYLKNEKGFLYLTNKGIDVSNLVFSEILT